MTKTWYRVANISDIDENDGITVKIDNKEIAIFFSKGKYYATDNYCTHGRAPLVDGYLDGEVIECPLHQGLFNLRTGKALCSPVTHDINVYPVKIVEDEIQINID